MKIILTKIEYENFALGALKTKYDLLVPKDQEVIISPKYSGEVEIEFIPKEKTEVEA